MADQAVLRRSLSPGQRAAITLEFAEMVDELRREARERQRQAAEATNAKLGRGETVSPELGEALETKGKIAKQLAEKAGIGRSSMEYLMAVQRDAPDLFDKVKSGEITINKAYTTKKEREQGEMEAEYLLIAENTERRGEAEKDPIKKARIAGFLKEYWGVRDGVKVGHNVQAKGLDDIGNFLGESRKSTQRLIKLNDLTPELQQLVSDGKLGTTAGEQLAYLTEDAQRELWDKLAIAYKNNSMKKDISREEKIEKAIELRKEGRSQRQIAEWLGVGKTTVARWTEEVSTSGNHEVEKTEGADGKLRPAKMPTDGQREERRQEVKQLREQGEKINDIADKLGVSVGTVHSDIKVIEKDEVSEDKQNRRKKHEQALDVTAYEVKTRAELYPDIIKDEPEYSANNVLINARFSLFRFVL